MTIYAADYKAMIVKEVGDEKDFLRDHIDLYWDMFTEQPTMYLTYLYVKRHCINAMMGRDRGDVTTRISGGGDVIAVLSDKMKHLEMMLEALNDTIDKVEESMLFVAGTSGWGRSLVRR